MNRRALLGMAAKTTVAGLLSSRSILGISRANEASKPSRVKVLFFDGFTVWDPRPVAALVEELFPGKGAVISAAWRTRQFEYNWLRMCMGTYADFWQCTQDALTFAAAQERVDLTAEKRGRLMNAFLQLKAWPDAKEALQTLKQRGFKLAFLSNLTRKMLETNIESAGLQNLFDDLLSTDARKTYKPDQRAYQMGLDRFQLRDKNEAVFVAFAGWDAAGAKTFGYPTFWNNRLKAPAEELGVRPDATGDDLYALVKFLS
jgi:2-haloacid dehalogenase